MKYQKYLYASLYIINGQVIFVMNKYYFSVNLNNNKKK